MVLFAWTSWGPWPTLTQYRLQMVLFLIFFSCAAIVIVLLQLVAVCWARHCLPTVTSLDSARVNPTWLGSSVKGEWSHSTLAEKIETGENHDVERTLFDFAWSRAQGRNRVQWLCFGRWSFVIERGIDHTIEQHPIDVMILGCLKFIGQGSTVYGRTWSNIVIIKIWEWGHQIATITQKKIWLSNLSSMPYFHALATRCSFNYHLRVNFCPMTSLSLLVAN